MLKKSLAIILLVLLNSVSFAFNQDYFNHLPSWDRYNINLVNKLLPSVVNIIGYKKTYRPVYEYVKLGDGFYVKIPRGYTEKGLQPVTAGTAFFISSKGILVTNAHVVENSNLTYKAVTYKGKIYPVRILVINKHLDLALLYIKGSNFKPVKLINSDNLMIGQTVFAIGNTLGQYPYTVSKGIISGLKRDIIAGGIYGSETLHGLIQTTAPISPGNSGGPLIDSLGNVVGVNTAVNLNGQNIGFAIPTNVLINWIYSLVRK